MCDLAHAALMEQFEGDRRAEVASGLVEGDIADARQRLEDALLAEPVRGKKISRERHELHVALGVA